MSTPAPTMSRSLTRKRAASSLNPGACIVPFASLFRNRSTVPTFASHPEYIATNAPAGSRPCCFSHASTSSTDRSASASFAARSAIEMTASGAKNLSAGSLSAVTALATKCTGASRCVPVCSSNVTSLAKKPSFAIENFGRI